MSGKIATNSGFVSKAEFTRMQSKMESVVYKMAELSREVKAAQQPSAPPSAGTNRKFAGGVKSWLYSKAGSRPPIGHTSSSNDNMTCQNCGNESTLTHHSPPGSEAGRHIYQKHVHEGGLDEHRRLRNELNLFQTEVKNEIRSLQQSVKDIEELYKSLEKLVNDSISDLQRTINGMKQQNLINTERPEQQGLEKKLRNVMAVTRYDKSNCKQAIDGLVDDGRRYSRSTLGKHTTAI